MGKKELEHLVIFKREIGLETMGSGMNCYPFVDQVETYHEKVDGRKELG